MNIKQIMLDYWHYEISDKEIEEIKDKEYFIKSYYEQQKFIKERTGRTINI